MDLRLPEVPTWGQINLELFALIAKQRAEGALAPGGIITPSPHDVIRHKYLEELANHTQIPVIVYASGWLVDRPGLESSVAVSTADVMGFMEAVHGLPRGPLDLMLHSPGGDPDAAQAIMAYLRAYGFDPIRAIVPVSAKSAATMMALSCDEIVMGRHSQLGPIDPQLTVNTPEGPRMAAAQAILDQFEKAKAECASNQNDIVAWLPILRSYLPGLLSQCINAQEAAVSFVQKALSKYMFRSLADEVRDLKAAEVARWFGNHKEHLSHGRPLIMSEVEDKGVNVTSLEADRDFQERVLSAWHGVQLTLGHLPVSKIVENSMGSTWLLQVAQNLQLVVGGPPANPPAPAAPRNPAQFGSNSKPGNRAARRKH